MSNHSTFTLTLSNTDNKLSTEENMDGFTLLLLLVSVFALGYCIGGVTIKGDK